MVWAVAATACAAVALVLAVWQAMARRRQQERFHERLAEAAASTATESEANRRRVDAVRRDFVSNISHELQTPVGALALLAETLVAETGDTDGNSLDSTETAVVRRLATRILHESLRIGNTMEDLLELARLEADVEPRRVPVKLRHLLNDTAARARSGAALRSVQLTVDAARGVVLADERQIVSALSNLVDNAVKYSPEGAVVALTAAVDEATGCAVITVRDRGVGIPEADLDRVFERFYRVDRARSRETGGTGLGLAIVRHVVANHGGEVTVTSVEGEGSTFVLRLPNATADPEAPGGHA